jgi:hypothetical protein
MPRIISQADCGNSPKNILLEKLTIAYAEGDTDFILNHVTNDISLTLVGKKTQQGKAAFGAALEQRKTNPIAELTIQHVLTHGKAGAVNGTTRSADGVTRAFCDVYEFNNAKGSAVKTITSYVIALD